ncbi:MAG: NAD-dependent epimerase/dehydratase family protein [Promethearchaeota archaeon]|nr:MAG: NAD-dependent epimerase/dehydratase family protein [Candidatus Lokiarchaeota archaeon]
MVKSKIVAITGANGYLGKNTIKLALKSGWDVHAIVRRKEVVAEVEELGAKPYLIPKFDSKKYEEAFKGCSAVIHFANIVCGSKEAFEKVNIEGFKLILDAAKNSGVKRIIYPSGLGVDKYGEKEWARNNYFWSKREAEKLLIGSDFDYRIFRPSYILGPGDELIPETIEQILDGKIIIAGKGDTPMQPIFIEDAATAFLQAAEGVGKKNTIYALVGPKAVTMNQLVELVTETIASLGLNVPAPAIEHVSYNQAAEKLDICTEMVDVMRCDILENGQKTANALNYDLSPLNDAIKAAIKDKLVHENINNERKAIVLFSGGIDSATTLFWAINNNFTVIALTINYKWRPKKEIEATKDICKLLKVPLVEVEAPYIQDAVDLRMEGYPVPSAIHAPQGFIPLRNLVFYSIAAYFAAIYGCQFVIGGHLKDDIAKFKDTSKSFFAGLKQLIDISKHSMDKSNVEFVFPFSEKTKAEVVEVAQKLNVPIEKTWSCYGDYETPCGRCEPCRSREKVLKLQK